MFYDAAAVDEFVGLADLAAAPHPSTNVWGRSAPGRKVALNMRRRGHSGFGFFGAASTVPRLARPAYQYKGYACAAGGGIRQNQLKAEAYCAATQALQAVVASCSPFQWYCDPTIPVKKRAGNPKAPAGQIAYPGGPVIAGGGGVVQPTLQPCPAGYTTNSFGQCTPIPSGSQQLCPPGYTYNPSTGQCYAIEQNGMCPQGATTSDGRYCYAAPSNSIGGLTPGTLPPGAVLMTPGQACPYGYTQQYYNGQYYCVPTGASTGLPPGAILTTPGMPCPAGYTQQYYNGQYYCVPYGPGSSPVGSCPPGAMFDPGSNACVSAISGQSVITPSNYYPSPYPQPYSPYSSYGPYPYSPYGGGMPPAPYGYTGPELTPIDEGAGADFSTGGAPIYAGGAAPMMMVQPYGPELDQLDASGMPISPGAGAGGTMMPDMTGGGPGMQFQNQAAFNQAAGGMPSPTSTSSNAACQQEAISKPGADQFGPFTVIQIVCAPSSPTAAVASGGSPMPGVYNPDEIASAEISTMTGLGRYIG
jgi:hypothetical protein